MFQGIRDFKTCYVLAIKYISTSKKPLNLLLNIRTILSSIKIEHLQKQQFVNYFVKNLNNKRKTTEFCFLYFTSSLKKYGKYVLPPSKSYCSYFYAVMISEFKRSN